MNTMYLTYGLERILFSVAAIVRQFDLPLYMDSVHFNTKGYELDDCLL